MTTLLKRKHALASAKKSYGSLVVADGASNYWKLDEISGLTAVDSIGGKNGTISGGVTLNQVGIGGGKSMTFDGTTGKILTAATILLPAIVTMELWIKTTDTVGFLAAMSTRNPNQAGCVYCGKDPGAVMSTYGFGAETASVTATGLNNGAWHYLVYIYNGSTVTFYQDAVNLGSGAFARSAQTVPTSLGIGVDAAGASNTWMGSIDEVAVYPLALSPAKIATHYASR